MIAPNDPYADWDAAYMLGALSPNDRRVFERHLGECEACSGAVAELAGMPGLLAAVPAERALAGEDRSAAGPAADEPRMPDTTLPRLLAAARRQQSRSRGLLAAALVGVAAVAATVALVLTGWVGIARLPGLGPVAGPPSTPPVTVAPTSSPATTLQMEQVIPSPLTADLRLEAQPWGTKIATRCSYAQVEGASGARDYALYVTDRAGASSLVATWAAGPGTTVTLVGTTSLAEAEIAALDIRSVSSGRVLLESRLAP